MARDNSSESWNQLAKIHERFGFFDQAIEAIKNAIEIDSSNFGHRKTLVELLTKKQDFDQAIAQTESLYDDAPDDHWKENAIKLRVAALTESGRAAGEIQRLLKGDPTTTPTAKTHWTLALPYWTRRTLDWYRPHTWKKPYSLIRITFGCWRLTHEC